MENQNPQAENLNPTPSVSQIEQTPSPTIPSSNAKNSKNSKFPIFLIILGAGLPALALIGIIAAILVMIIDPLGKTKQNKITHSPTPSVTVRTSPTPTPDPTVGWKRYVNTAFFYSVKYPVDWNIGVKGDSKPETFSAPNFNSPCNYQSGQLCSQIFIEVSQSNSKNDLNPEFIINSSGDRIFNKSSTKIDEKEASAFDWFQSSYGIHSEGRLLHIVVTQNNNYKYTITYEESQQDHLFHTPQDWQKRNTFDQILSTFKFTDTNSLTQNDIDGIKASLAAHEKVVANEIANFTSELYSDPLYASGNFSLNTPGSGAKWFAQKSDGKWEIIYTGNGLPKCVDVAKYNAPKDFLSCF